MKSTTNVATQLLALLVELSDNDAERKLIKIGEDALKLHTETTTKLARSVRGQTPAIMRGAEMAMQAEAKKGVTASPELARQAYTDQQLAAIRAQTLQAVQPVVLELPAEYVAQIKLCERERQRLRVQRESPFDRGDGAEFLVTHSAIGNWSASKLAKHAHDLYDIGDIEGLRRFMRWAGIRTAFLADAPPGQLPGKVTGYQSGEIDKERSIARDLRSWWEKIERENLPPDEERAERFLSAAQQLFKCLFGYTADDNRRERGSWERKYDPWRVKQDWPLREIAQLPAPDATGAFAAKLQGGAR